MKSFKRRVSIEKEGDLPELHISLESPQVCFDSLSDKAIRRIAFKLAAAIRTELSRIRITPAPAKGTKP